MSGPPFTMSKYVSELDLLRDKSAWLERELAKVLQQQADADNEREAAGDARMEILRAAIDDECRWLTEERDRMVSVDDNIRACMLDQRRSTLAAALADNA